MQHDNHTPAEEFNLQAFLAWCWWLVKVSTFVVSVTLNIIFVLLLLEIRAGY